MNTSDVKKVLKTLDWSPCADEVGDEFAHFYLPDRIVQIIYGVRDLGDGQQLAISLSLSTKHFSKACSEILGEVESYMPLVRAWKGYRLKQPEVLEEHVRQKSEKAISWAKDQDLTIALQEYASLPMDAPGARPIWHLAALALLQDVDRLKFYKGNFEAKNRLGFVNYVTSNHISRALALIKLD